MYLKESSMRRWGGWGVLEESSVIGD